MLIPPGLYKGCEIMIAKYIIENAQYHAIQILNTSDGYVLLNEALKEVAVNCVKGRIADNTMLNAVKNEWAELPKRLISIEAVYDISGKEVHGYNIDGTRIRFKESDVNSIEYKRIPNEIPRGLESAVPEVHELFHSKLEFYIAARVRLKFNHEDGEGMRLLSEFYNGIKEVNDALSRGKKNIRIKAPIWR